MPLSFIYFDLGNVLLHFDHSRGARQMAEVAGISTELAYEVVFQSDLENRYERGDLDCQDFYDEFCHRTGTQPDFVQLKQAAGAIFEPNEVVFAFVRKLHTLGHKLGILSNTCAAHWEYCIDGRYPVLNTCFQHYALSYELKSMKPDAAIYTRSAELAGVAPEQILFIDDRLENIAGAQAMGWDAIHYQSASALEQALVDRGCFDRAGGR